MEVSGVQALEKKILIIIDKTDKIGIEGVVAELQKEDISPGNLKKLIAIYSFRGDNKSTISFLRDELKQSETGLAGVEELHNFLQLIDRGDNDGSSSSRYLQSKIVVDLTLARGLEYYTGIIFEVKAPAEVKIGSIGGGGRYDDLTGLFGVPGIPGVGISFGVDRIFDVMEELKVFPVDVHIGTQVLFFNLGEAERNSAFSLLQRLREKGVRSEIYHEQAKFDKQFKYAEKKSIPYIVIIGSKEMEENTCILRSLNDGQQKTLERSALLLEPFKS
jgi:histidyl-tRNA synthetase